MAETRDARLITKRTSVPGKIPTGTTGDESSFIRAGELASNLSDHSLWGYDGANVFEYGSSSFLGLTGGTISGNVFIGGGLSATTLSGGVILSGATNLYDIFSTTNTNDITRVQSGSNIVTGGTANAPIINLTASPSVNNLTFSGTVIGGSIQVDSGILTSLSATTLSGDTIIATNYIGNGASLTGISGSFGITIDGAGSVITSGVKGYVIMPYNATIVGWNIIGDTIGNCVFDVWRGSGSTIPTILDSISGTEEPKLTSQQINYDNSLISWDNELFINDIIAFNIISATTLSRITLTIKVIKK